jgi:AraC-like DNA-binding protein
MPRPPKTLTNEQLAQLEKLASKLTIEQLADFFGMGERTLRRKFHNDPAVLAAYKKGKAKAISGVAGGLLRAIKKGNVTAMIFYLKTQAGWREIDPKQVPARSLKDLSDKQLEKERRRLGLVA